MKRTVRIVAASAAVAAGMGLAGLAVATEAHAQPGPLPTWCPGEFWDPGWGNNWDWGGCHENFYNGWAGGPRDDFGRHDDFGRRDDFGRHDGWDHR
ncbi:hypothetical protein [Mycobacterium sp.]|uniref:hypothetical protein n=1 Tax=Mycobacterium sp. TaxID=1785 RepID=UPI003D0C229F